jgi:hypothetical protein
MFLPRLARGFCGRSGAEFIQRFFAAVEGLASMFLVDRLFVPCRHDYYRFGNARAAASSFALGAGGFSSKLRTRKLSVQKAAPDPPPR